MTVFEIEKLINIFGDKIKAFNRNHNVGKGGTIREGINFCTHDYVLITDADNDISILSIKKMLREFELITDIKIFVGDKYHPKSQVNVTRTRKIFSKGFKIYSILVLRQSFSDTQTGLKLFEKNLLERILIKTRITGFSIDTEILYLAAQERERVVKVPVIINRNLPTTVSVKSAIIALIDIIKIKIYHS